MNLNYSQSAQNQSSHILRGDEFRLVRLIDPNKSGNEVIRRGNLEQSTSIGRPDAQL